ncbi:U1 small nuclear ribonucleoprotein usp102 [Yarrowia sp. C11]|nr:U1 small nuclear ribonucleoprotein usp102 [Yarrowia sp. E02]KAG5367506.1 U1 small nuclear ribonucleoprotein usp102 [Yarrowia sp. C11]
MTSIAPCETIYIRNINEKVKIPTLKSTLKEICKEYGDVLDVVAHGNLRLRGQAFVVFDSIDSAESAISALNSTKLDGLKGSVVEVTYAKSRSDATVAKKGASELDSHVRARVAQKELKQLADSNKRRAEPVRAAETVSKKVKTAPETTFNPVHNILLLQNLPKSASQEAVAALFSELPGYVEVRLVPARQVGFAEFENDEQAVVAKEKSQGAEIDGEKLLVSYAKK